MSVRPELRRELREPIGFDPSQLRKMRMKPLAIRFLFGAAVALGAGLVGMRFGPKVGGVFLAFPAVLPAALSIVEKKEGEAKADIDALGAVVGSSAMVVFALVARSFLAASPALALGLSWLAWLLVAMAIYTGGRALLRRLL